MTIRDNTYSDYFKVHTLAAKAKDGDEVSYTYLLKCFANLLRSYDKLHQGSFNGTSRSIALFLKYFDKRTNLPMLMRESKGNNSYVKRTKGFKNFKSSIALSRDDFRQEILLAFATIVKRYKTNACTFAYFIDRFFHLVLLERLKLYIRNMAINNLIEEPSMLNSYSDYLLELSYFNISDDKLNYNVHKSFVTNYNHCRDDIFDMNWIRGLKGEKFLELTPLERTLIIRKYLNKNTDKEIANSCGVCRATINRIKGRVKEKLS